jgi:PAS domain S-box-containing protein
MKKYEKKLEAKNEEYETINEELRQTNEELIAARLKAEKSREEINLTLDATTDGIWKWDFLTNVLFFSPNYYRMLGYEPDEFEANYENWAALIHPEDKENAINTAEKWLERKEGNYENTFRLKTKNDDYMWVISTGKVVERDKQGNALRMIGNHINISAVKEAEINLIKAKEDAEQSEEKFSTIFNMSQSLICIADINTSTFKYINPAFNRVLGFSDEELLSKPFLEFIHPDDVQTTQDVVEKQLQAGIAVITFENRYLCKNGGYRWFNWNSYPLPEKGITYAIAHDVTELKKTEIALQDSNEEYEAINEELRQTNEELFIAKEKAEQNEANVTAIIEGNNHSIWAFDKEYKILYINHFFQEDFLQSFGVLLKPGMSLINVLPESIQPFWQPRYDRVLAGEQFTIEDAVPTELGTIFVEVTFNPIVKNGKVIGGSCFGSDITSRKRAEQELQNSNEEYEAINEELRQANEELIIAKEKAEENGKNYRSLFNFSMDAIYIHDHQGNIIDVNKAACEQSGYSQDEWKKMTVFDGLSDKPDSINLPKDKILEIWSSWKPGQTALNEAEQKHKNGNVYPVEIATSTVKFGSRFLLLALVRDITERKKYEKELIKAKEIAEESELKLKHSQEIAKLGSWELDIETETFTFNDSFYKIFHTSAEEIGGYQVPLTEYSERFVHPDDSEMVALETEKAVKTDDPKFTNYVEQRINYFDGGVGYIAVRYFVIKDENGKTIKTYGVNQDITEKKNAEIEILKAKEKAEESERKLLEAQELSHVGSWEYYIDTDIVIWSKELYNIFERSYDLPAPKYSEQSAFYTKESFAKLDEAVQKCALHGTPYDIDLDIITSSGSTKHIIAKGESLKDTNNNIIGLYGTAQDITQKKELELALIKAKEKAEESDHLKSAFLANMSHEIRTPMNGILGFTNLLREPDLTGEEKEEFIDIIQKSGNRMLDTVNDIIEISKIETGQITVSSNEVNVSEHILSLQKFFRPEAEKKGLKLIIDNELSVYGSLIITDKNKLSSILTNLIKNAIKFTEKGHIIIGCKRNADFIELYVKDSGIGIPSQRQDAIFNRFEKADIEDKQVREGSGLGLAIVKSYVNLLGGNIWVNSEVNEGSTFFFTIPYKPVHSSSDNKNGKDWIINDEVKNFNILIVEDDHTSSKYLTILLKDFTKNIQIAKDGLRAVEICKNDSNIDLILMDYKLPNLNGLEATRRIREFNKNVKIIAQTAHALEGDKEKAMEAGCNDYITKPIDRERLLIMINKHLKIK